MIDAQSQEVDPKKRMTLVASPRRGSRWAGAWIFAHQAYVKNLISHQVVYNCWRLVDVWLDK